MNTFTKRIELLANLAIIVVAILLGVALVKHYLSPQNSTPPASASVITPGTKLSLPDLTGTNKTLIMALSTSCHYCTESAPFYKRLAEERGKNVNVKLVAVFPQAIADGKEYLNGLQVSVDDVRQSRLDSLGVIGTPTLILVNNQGMVQDSWRGRLNQDQEAEVLRRLQ